MDKKKSDKKKKNGIAYLLVAVPGCLTLLVLLFIVLLSFFSNTEYLEVFGPAVADTDITTEYAFLRLLPHRFSVGQYLETLWQNSDFWYYFWNSIRISLPIMLGISVVGLLGGYAFAHFEFPGKKIFLAAFILLMMVPYQVFLAPQYRVLYDMGILRSQVSVILPNIFAPFGAFMMYQYASKLPEETFEAAHVDGAGEIRIFFQIALPQLKNGIASLVLLNLIDTWNMVEQPMVFLTNEFRFPLSVALNNAGSESSMGGFVGSIIFMVPLFLVFLLGKERLIEGIGESVVK